MSNSREGPNPLRPYYIPPSIGIPPDAAAPSTHNITKPNGSAASYASSARDIFSDIDYSDYLSDNSPSSVQQIKELVDQALYKYLSILLSQPFEVSKTVLQVRHQVKSDGAVVENVTQKQEAYRDDYNDYNSDSDPDEPAYFTSSASSSNRYVSSKSQRHVTDRAGYVLPSPSGEAQPHQLVIRRHDSIMEVMGQLWQKEGAWGVWKSSNTTFVYGVLFKTIESWSRGLLAALLNVPDPGVIAGLGAAVDVGESQYPWASLGVAVAAAAAAGVLLAPLDIVRTKLIITPTTSSKRSLTANLRALPSYICPAPVLVPTILHNALTPLFTHATPIILRARFAIDPILTPTTYAVSTFLSSTVELFVKLPIETVLRRGQMSVLKSPLYTPQGTLDTIVDVGPYRGVVGTMWNIVREEGETKPVATASGKTKPPTKGQGMEGLWRGWRVGMWGLVGIWGAAALGGAGGSGGEF